jgi:uncharacterized membrane protein
LEKNDHKYYIGIGVKCPLKEQDSNCFMTAMVMFYNFFPIPLIIAELIALTALEIELKRIKLNGSLWSVFKVDEIFQLFFKDFRGEVTSIN